MDMFPDIGLDKSKFKVQKCESHPYLYSFPSRISSILLSFYLLLFAVMWDNAVNRKKIL